MPDIGNKYIINLKWVVARIFLFKIVKNEEISNWKFSATSASHEDYGSIVYVVRGLKFCMPIFGFYLINNVWLNLTKKFCLL